VIARHGSRIVLAVLFLGLCGCPSRPKEEVVVYAALDREFAEPVLNEFEKTTGIRVLAKYDDEGTKTVGLTNILFQEAARPRCDVFWNNEILNTLRLAERGLLEPYSSRAAEPYPRQFRAPDGEWHGFAARARILIVNTQLVAEVDRPRSIYDLANPKWKGRVGIARPIAGTTASHVAYLFAALGAEPAKDFFRSLKTNDIQILGGNKQVAQACAAGRITLGLTDTDDAAIEMARASHVAMVFPDSRPDQLGTLQLPNTLALIKSCPHQDNARKLIDFLLSPGAEAMLALSPSAQIPLNPLTEATPKLEIPAGAKWMSIDPADAAKAWDEARRFIEHEFLAN